MESPQEPTEYLCETWGTGDASLRRYAPLTRDEQGRVWIHPMLAKDYPREIITARATRIWSVSGSFWNPGVIRLTHSR